jgi:hypothetical protein
MALRGSLREFELADIFQLISHDGKTGQLVLSLEQQEGFVIFSQGAIVAAGNDNQNLQTMLFNYLIMVKRYSEEELNELLYLCQGEMRLFSQELTNRNYITREELTSLVKLGIEDLACSLFLWEDGHYRFDSLDNMDDYVIAGVMLPADAITMEAMRRSDEWKRMRRNISDDTVFSLSPNNTRKKNGGLQASPLYDPVSYVASLVDGASSIAVLCKKSIFSQYRVYEILFGLWQDSEVYPLSVKHAPAKAHAPSPSVHVKQFLAASATFLSIAAWVALLALSSFFAHRTVFRQRILSKQETSAMLPSAQSMQKISIARLQYHAEKGVPAATLDQIYKEGILFPSEVQDHSGIIGALLKK